MVHLSRDFNILASYYGVSHVCHLPILCIVSRLHFCYLKLLGILSVSIHWDKYCGYCLKNRNNKDCGGKLPAPFSPVILKFDMKVLATKSILSVS